jgi:glycogen debranching enzyme
MIRVLLLSTDASDAEERQAWAWLTQTTGIVAERAPAAESGSGRSDDVVWLHSSAPPDPSSALLAALRSHRPAGGWLFTGGAAALAAPLGLGPPADTHQDVWHDQQDELFFHGTFTESPRLRGHAGFRDHPLFHGLHNGAYTWNPRAGEHYVTVTLARSSLPDSGRVLATERAYIHVNAARATAWEQDGPAGYALCIGAYLPFAAADPRFRPHVERLAHNALLHVARGAAGAASWRQACWPSPGRTCVRDYSLPLPHVRTDRPGRSSFAATPLRMAGGQAGDPFTLAGRRALAAGSEGAGVGELWVHPLRALAGLRLAGSSLLTAEVTALGLERALNVNGVTVDERVLVPHELGAMVVEWEAASEVTLTLEWTTDLRLMWPYPAGALGDLHWRAAGGTLLVRAAGAPDAVCCHLSRPPLYWEVQGEDGAAPCLHVRTTLTLPPGESLRLLVAASASGDDDLQATLAALRDPLSLSRARTASLRRLQHDTFSIRSPDSRLDEALEWAKYRLDSYLVATPAVGRSLVAGYWRSRPGWGDGRPGYAWYFGRDAAWTSLASLALGDFDAAADVIRFLGERQDQSGKVLHECTTSGLVHYDAADSTPLYLLLVARNYAWTGDLGFLNTEWERVERALRFCLTTDTDGDGLIENPGVGHGWIEFGPLGGGKVTYYNAGIWTAALGELAQAAQDMGAASLAAELYNRAGRARQALEERFFDPAGGRYALKAWQEDERWRADFTPTATHAVPLLLGVADPERAGRWLDDVASSEFSADWGVRLISRLHPLFNPESYHGGAVWPLFTGWVAWAEYRAGRAEAAFRHLQANAALAFERAKGAWDEVLHGSERAAVGVCPDQAWSTAMTVAPLVYGLLGAEPDAARNRLRLRPQLPDAWDRFEARMLRMGDAAISLRYERHQQHHVFRLEQERGAVPVRVILEPVLAGRGLRHALVDGQPASLGTVPFAGRMIVPVQLVLDAERVVEIHTE